MNSSPKTDYKTLIIVISLAFFLWLVVRLNRVYDHAYNIPLKVINNNPQKCLKYSVPELVRVEFTARGVDLIRLNFREIFYEVDISDLHNEMVMNLTDHPEFVRFPEAISVPVKSILRPQQINFQLDDALEVKLPVEVEYNIQTSPGYTLVQVLPKPDSVTVFGPATYLDTLKTLRTEKKTYKEMSSTFQDNFRFEENREYYAKYSREIIDVEFDIQVLAEKEINNVPVEVINIPRQYDVVPLPSFVRIYIKGGDKVLAQADKEDFQVILNFSKWNRNSGRIAADIKTELKLLYVETRPSQFDLIVQHK
jgi:YbbR domain-containing protein